jgi:hypothetical protein
MRDRYDYLEFEIGNAARFDRLTTMFEKLRRLKEQYPHPISDQQGALEGDPSWMECLDEEARTWFTKSEDWSFENTLYWIGQGWFRLIELRKEEANKGILFYELTDMDDAAPFIPLLEAFGNRIVYDSRHGRLP